jgi:predicted GNAT superfamily acetyltransferase
MTRTVTAGPAGARPAVPTTLPDGTVIRPLSSDRDELEACVDLQYAIWGDGFADVASPHILRIVQSMGGVAAGAFSSEGGPGGSPEEKLLGFVFGITGIKDGRPLHWSHMLAVLPEARGRDLGYRLKLYQRERLLPLGIDVVRWTFDPLVSKNAHLNLARLGAQPVDYLLDYYGSGEDSALSAGLGTDRFLVEWRLDEPPPEEPEDPGPEARGAPVVNESPEGGTDAPVVRIEVPGDIQAVRRESASDARAWRASTRRAFQDTLARGYRVTGFYRAGAEDGGRSFYVLRKGGS